MIYVIPYFLVFNRLGLDDTHICLIIMNMIYTIPLVTWMLLSFFEEIPISVEESAMVDGASKFKIMTKINLPIIMPGIVSSAILAFIFSWNEFLFALVMTKKVAPDRTGKHREFHGLRRNQLESRGRGRNAYPASGASFFHRYSQVSDSRDDRRRGERLTAVRRFHIEQREK